MPERVWHEKRQRLCCRCGANYFVAGTLAGAVAFSTFLACADAFFEGAFLTFLGAALVFFTAFLEAFALGALAFALAAGVAFVAEAGTEAAGACAKAVPATNREAISVAISLFMVFPFSERRRRSTCFHNAEGCGRDDAQLCQIVINATGRSDKSGV